MQGHLHHLQQQLAALLSAAADGADSSAPEGRRERDDDAGRVAALDSLQRTILYPHNALLLSHSAPFLCQGLSQLLSDKSYAVRRAAAVAYGSLCAIVISTPLSSNALQNHVLGGGLADRFVGWALPLLGGDIGVASGSAQLALEGLREFLNVGDAASIDRFVPPILKACQELLEDERTSLSSLHQLLSLLSLISLRFGHCFQPHFADIVDLLLGWAFVPDLSESDRRVIMDSFLQFQKHWLSNLQFSLGLLSKFLGDMEVLIQDAGLETVQQPARLLALFSCFSTVLQVMASGVLEMNLNLLEMIREHLEGMASRLVRCILMFGAKFGWLKWTGESWRCLILLAEMLQDKFSSFYAMAIDILFRCLSGIPSFQVQAVLRNNLQLLSLQKLGLRPSSVQTILRFESPLSLLRLHPNHLVVATSAATYLFFLQHGSDRVASQAITCLTEELELLKGLLGKADGRLADLGGVQEEFKSDLGSGKGCSELELLSLMKFDLKILQSSVSLGSAGSLPDQIAIDTVRYERSMRLTSFILEKLDPFKPPIQGCLELQAHVVRALHKFSEFELLSKLAIFKTSRKRASGDLSSEGQGSIEATNARSDIINEYLRKYSASIARALDVSSPLAVKLEALVWIRTFGQVIMDVDKDAAVLLRFFCEPHGDASVGSDLLFSILDAAYDRESKVRSHVATVLEALMQAHLIDPRNFYSISEVVLDKLGDPDASIKNAFVRVLSVVLLLTIYSCGLIEDGIISSKLVPPSIGHRYYLNWKHTLALKQLPRKLQSQQLVSILSYISQRWKMPLSSWIQRLVFTCCGKKDVFYGPQEVVGDAVAGAMSKDAKVEGVVLEKICPVNTLAAIWWSIHEAARHCVALRLRTNLGGPTQTFAALERMLLDIPNVLLLDAEQGDSKYLGSSNLHLLPMWLLLDFVEALKKNVYNAYEGSSVLLASPRSSSLFFRANKKVCEEWFSRICEPMMNAGLALHCHDATLHYCSLRLQDLRNLVASTFKDKSRGPAISENLQSLRTRLTEDVLRVLRYSSLALCRSHEPEALIGLQKWVAVTFSSLFKEDNQRSPGVTGSFGHLSWMTGLVHQAHGQYERAAAHFSHLLQSEDALLSLGSDGIQFVIARVIECYTSLCDWKSLENWLAELQALRAMHAGKAYSGALTTAGNELNATHALACFDEGDFQAAWGYLDLTPKSSCELTLDPKVALDRSEQMFLRSMLQRDGSTDKVLEELDKAKLMLDEALSIVPLEGLAGAGVFATQLHCIFAFEETIRSNGQGESKHFSSLLSSLHQVLQSPISRIHQDCSLWIKVFRVYRTVLPTSPVTLLLCQKLFSLARKQRNFMLADRMKQYFINHPLTSSELMHTELLDLNLQYEGILLKYAEGKHEEALIELWSLVRDDVLCTTTNSSATGSVLKAKACLKLSTWLRQENPNINLHNILLNICEDFNAYNSSDNFTFTRGRLSFSDGNVPSDTNYHAVLEEIVGTATKLSCHLCPTMGKTWLSYASWCFSQAKGSLSVHGAVLQSCLSPVLSPELTADRYQLTEDEKSKVEALIKKICHSDGNASNVEEEQLVSTSLPENDALVNSLVHQAASLMQAAAGAPGFESCDGECPSVSLSSQLQVLFLCTNAGLRKHDILSLVDELVGIWWSLRQRRVSLFGHAARGFFQYLTHASNFLVCSHDGIMKEKSRSCTLRAMLYILHIIVNYGFELKEMLEHGLGTVPLLPWQEIIPQLFARLSSHPKQAVRRQLEGLLMMLARLSPCSIVYPTLVDLNACEGDPSEELQRLLDCLSKLYPKLIQDVQLVINELGAITVLWEEQWLSTLQDLHTDVIRRINLLKEEAARIAANSTLSHAEKNKINAAKYSAMMAPIVVALERRLASTSREPKTAHELWFHKEYGEQLKSAILSFKTPPGSAMALGDVWRPFNVIAASLATRHRKSVISLSEVAPQLALLSSSDVPMPGFEKQDSMLDSSGCSTTDVQGPVTISSFCEQVTVLSTKTKPKKLVLQGSNGQKYTYLLKGREDLRLDARIMQMLQAINSFCYSCTDTRSRSISIRYYSVTPISGRAGLIQWVDNVTSIYSVYKSWQTRTQIAQLSVVGASNANNPVPHVARPSDMFYGKIIPALKEKGIRRVISRRDWPLEVKRKVLLELMKETPRHLLWQEMWCVSEGFRAFTLKAKRFSGSVAAMSMVGHILGLGDRHLDNILMDFCSGDVVHIDYNICFDKGRRLKIPEIVPFRLTQIMETALGLTGTEGTFRANCEAVMSVLQKNKDIILMLLEVFVWDPLVEWTRGDGHDEAAIGGEEKKGMELAVSLSLFASRVQEIRVPLQEHHDLLVATLPAAESALVRFLDVLNQYEVISAIFYHADKERSRLLQHETSAKSVVAEANSISEKARASFEVQAHEFAQAKAVVVDKSQELATWVDQHGRVLDALQSDSIPDMQACIKLSGMEEAFSLTSAVLVSGVPLTIVPEPTRAQCYDLDREVSHIVAELDNGLSSAIEALHEYALALQRILPLNYITTSPVSGWAHVLQLSVNSISSDFLSLARRQAGDVIAKTQGESADLVQQRHHDLIHKMERCIMEIEKVDDERSELMNSIGSDAEAKSKERLLSAFTKYMQSAGYSRNEDDTSSIHLVQKNERLKDLKVQGDLEEKKVKMLSVLNMAVNELYEEVKAKVIDISHKCTSKLGWRTGDDGLQPDSVATFHEFEEQIEKCVLVAGFVNEVQELVGIDLPRVSITTDDVKLTSEGNWASVFQSSLYSARHLIEQMTEVVLPEIIKLAISYNSEVMEAFGTLSQIRGSIDTALEKLTEVELERASLIELEKNYFVKVGLITEQQLALEEAAVKGRDHLSWEEAEELASQEEACRAQLEQLHQTWNQKDMRSSSLIKIETNIKNSLISTEHILASLISVEKEGDPYNRSKALLAALVEPFSKLESIDQMLPSYGTLPFNSNCSSSNLPDLGTFSSSLSESMWGFASLLKNHAFFVWKVGILDSILDICIHDISSSVDHNLGFDQLCNGLKKKLEIHLQEQVNRYLKERVATSLLVQIDKENENLQHMIEARRQFASDQVKRDSGAVRRVQLMLEEYCNAHETARAARSAISLMKRQVNELTEALGKAMLEIVQMGWLHDLSLPYLLKTKVLSQKFLGDDEFLSLVLNLSRSKLLEKIQSSMSTIARSLECLQACERTSLSAEGQLERAMGWACAGPNVGTGSSSSKGSGIPSAFHDHLLRRRQLLWAAREQASDIIKICASVMEFEASRDGLFWIPGEKSSGQTTGDGRTWQQAYLNALKRLDVAYHSFTRAEQEWKLAQNNLEAAANGLFSATNELCIASVKAKSASGDLQDNLAAMWEHAKEASVALSDFSHVSKGHTALTTECGSMLEEVLAITEGLHDIYSLGKEASAAHSVLMADLSKANMILLPIESSLSTDVAAMADAISKEGESNADVSLIHGQALYQSYIFRLREACQSLVPLVPSLIYSVKELHSTLTKLARASSLHAGNLHKALEGLGESQMVRSQDLALSRSELSNGSVLLDKDKGSTRSSGDSIEDLDTAGEFSLLDEGWISPPEHTYTSSALSNITLREESLSENLDKVELFLHGINAGGNSSTRVSSTHTDEKQGAYVEKPESECSREVDSVNSQLAAVPPDPSISMQALSLLNEATVTQPYSVEEIIEKTKPSHNNNEQHFLKQVRGYGGSHDDPSSCSDSASRIIRGKNAYALSVLRQVELKIDGRDVEDTRSLKIAEQVDFLLKQATSIDNLCNMYEGWTPWI